MKLLALASLAAITSLTGLLIALPGTPANVDQSPITAAPPGTLIARAPSTKPAAETPPKPPRGWAQAAAEKPEPRWRPVNAIPADAVAVVLQDLGRVRIVDRPFVRWIFSPTGEEDDWRALSDVLAKVSRSAYLYPVFPDRLVSRYVARIDLRMYWPVDGDLAEVLDLWEQFQFDPSFSLLITGDTIKTLSDASKAAIHVQRTNWAKEKTKEGGSRWTRKGFVYRSLAELELEVKLRDLVVVRRNATHLDRSGLEMVQDATSSLAPIVELDYFCSRATSTIKDRTKVQGKDGKETLQDNLFSVVWGGLYSDLAGIRAKTADVKTDLQQFFIDVGIGSKNEEFQQFFDRLRSDERVVMERSSITGKVRLVAWIGTATSRLSIANGTLWITFDIQDRDVDLATDPNVNLVTATVRAYEIIWTRANGQQGYALFGAAGNLLEEAVFDVAADRLEPSPRTTRLQSGIGCIRCHGPHDGYWALRNDAKKMLARKLRRPGGPAGGPGIPPVDVFGDISQRGVAISDTLDRLAGWYSGDPNRKTLPRARDDYAEAVLRATGPWKSSQRGQADVVQLSSARIAKIWARDRADMITPAEALRRLGIPTREDEDEVDALERILPPDGRAAIAGLIPEDSRIAAVRDGTPILPRKWALVYNFALERAQTYRKAHKLPQPEENGP